VSTIFQHVPAELVTGCRDEVKIIDAFEGVG